MSSFMTEWLGANLKDGDTKMHKSARRRKQVFDMNNARNRDIISNAKAGGFIDTLDGLDEHSSIDPALAEDRFIENLEIDQEMVDAAIEALRNKLKD